MKQENHQNPSKSYEQIIKKQFQNKKYLKEKALN